MLFPSLMWTCFNFYPVWQTFPSLFIAVLSHKWSHPVLAALNLVFCSNSKQSLETIIFTLFNPPSPPLHILEHAELAECSNNSCPPIFCLLCTTFSGRSVTISAEEITSVWVQLFASVKISMICGTAFRREWLLNILTGISLWAETLFSFEVNLRSPGSELETSQLWMVRRESLPDKIVLKGLTAVLGCYNFLWVYQQNVASYVHLNLSFPEFCSMGSAVRTSKIPFCSFIVWRS